MHEKDTEKLFSELKEDPDIRRFLTNNKSEMRRPVSEYLNGLIELKGLRKADVIKESGINQNYAYHIFSGEKQNPSRVKLLAIAFSMRLKLSEIQYLLRYGGHSPLYPRNPWDSVVISAIERGLSLRDTNALLAELGETKMIE